MQAYVVCLKQHGVDLPANGRVFGIRNGQGGQVEGSPPGSFQLRAQTQCNQPARQRHAGVAAAIDRPGQAPGRA